MIRLQAAGAVQWQVPPGGHFFPTVGKVCYTREEYQREADKCKKAMVKEWHGESN